MVGARYAREQRLERRERALVGGHAGRRRAVELDRAAAHDHRERGVAADEREPAPPLRVLDRLEEEAGRSCSAAPTSFTNAETGVSRSASTSRQTGTTVWSRAERDELVAGEPHRGSAAIQTGPGVAPLPKARKKQLCSPVWQAPRPSCSTTKSSTSTSQS